MQICLRTISSALLVCGVTSLPSVCLGAELYLPLHQNPALEAKIEKALILANMPVSTRPIATSTVHKALNKIGSQHSQLKAEIAKYLRRFSHRAALTHANLQVSTSTGAAVTLSNQRGSDTNSSTQFSATGYWTLSNWITLHGGTFTYTNNISTQGNHLENSYISVGNNYFQADIGYRPHWLGPLQDSDMLTTTNAPAPPSITFSNTLPLTRAGIRYEVFFAQMSESKGILSDDRSQRLTGKPKLFGVHTSITPIDGFTLGLNRLMQYGGADRKSSLSDLKNAFFNVKASENIGMEGTDFGNQLSSITVSYTFSGDHPVKVDMEYAGEDTSATSDYHLGNSALLLGLHLPAITESLDLSYEYAQWQNAWYVNSNYEDGLRQNQNILGHWGANHRDFPNATDASANSTKLSWYIEPNKTLITKVQWVENTTISTNEHEDTFLFNTEYTQTFNKLTIGATLTLGRAGSDKSFSQLSGLIRW